MRLSTFAALTSVSIAALVLGAAPATAQVAQDEPPAPSGAAGDAPNPECLNLPEGDARDRCISGEVELESGQAIGDDEEIVVTGSRIRNPNVSSPVPITSVSAEELTDQGDVNVGDALNDLPSLRSTFSQANSTRFIGTAGVNLLDLRGLGTERTLVLVNGRRHVTYNPGTFQVDVNTIPTDLIERVDIVTGGSSAVYGSDAVAGVVNFILKRDFDGIRLRGQGGTSSRGDRGIQFITLTAGENLFDDRANVAINLEYVNAEPLFVRQRPGLTGAFDGRCQFNLAEPTAGEPPEGDGVPDKQFFCGVRNLTISTGGTAGGRGVGVFGPTSPFFAFSCTNPNLAPALASRCLNPGTPQGQPAIVAFQPDGTACRVTPSLDFRPFGSGNFIQAPNDPCQGGTTLRETGQLAPGLDRYTANLLAHYEVSDALRPFVEAKFARVDALQEGQPSFFQGSFAGFFGGGRGVQCDNPFLTPQNIAVLQTVGRCLGGPTSPETIFLSRFNVDFGGRQQEIRRDTYRVVGGLTGDFNDDWNYEVSLNYGRSSSDTKARNNLVINDIGPDGELLEGPFLRAVDAVRAPNGQIVCRVNADADPTNNDPNCVPVNLFGNQRPSQAALDNFNTTSLLEGKASQFDALAFVSGDASQLFEFQGGAPSFVIGGEYRTEKAHEEADPLSAAGATFFNAFPEFDPPKLKVREFFGEIQLPIFRDVPFARELTLTGAARHSDYNTAADTTFAWNANATWAPIRDLRLRGNYSKSVRVPTLGDLFQPATQNFAFVSDPCDVLFIGTGSPNRAANCAALGVPAGFVNTVARSQTIEIVSGGNPNLEEETGKGFTLGGVFTPSFVPGLSLSVDFYKIRVENIIATLSAQTILNQCVDLPNINNQFCALIFPRQPDGLFAQPALLSSGVNFARQVASGIDIDATYRRTFANGHRLLLRGIATRVLKRDNFISPTDPDFADRQLSELGDPKWAANATIGYGFGNFDMRYNLNYIGKQTIGAFENYFSVQGRPPQNEDFTEEVFYPDVLYHAIRFSLNVPQGGRDRMTFYIGADNIFDTEPPLGLLGTGGGDPFDAIGRYFYAGATIDF